MSILIKDMKMPKNCGECPCFLREYFYCNAKENNYTKLNKRPQDCPLVELPDIYIDIAKAFMTELTDKVCIKGDEDNEHLN